MTDERPRRPRRVAAPPTDTCDAGVTIRRVNSDGSYVGTTPPGAIPSSSTPEPKPASSTAPKPTEQPAREPSATRSTKRRSAVPRPKPVAAPRPEPTNARVEAPSVTAASTVDVVIPSVAQSAGSDETSDAGPFDFDDLDPAEPFDALLGNVAGDAPLETKPTVAAGRPAKHDLVDDGGGRTKRGRRVRRHPGRGVFGGALIGAGTALMLVLYGLLPLGEVTLAIPVVVFSVVGFVIGSFGPVRGGRPAKATMHVPDSPTSTGITPITPLTTTATADADAHRMSGSEDLGTVFGRDEHDDDVV